MTTIFVCDTSIMNSVSSRSVLMNGSMYPEMIEDFWIGMMMRTIRLNQPIPWIIADSSSSWLSWSIEFREAIAANGI